MRVIRVLVSLFLMVSFLLYVPVETHAASELDTLQKNLNASIKQKNWTNAAIYSKKIAVYYDDRKNYDQAAKYYDESANYWTKAGHPSWGIQNAIRADHIRTEVDLYVEKPIPLKNLAKFEPMSGTYLGLYLAGKKEKASPYPVKDIYGKNHALYLTYTKWGQTYSNDTYFPMKFAQAAKDNGSGIQIGFEPSNGLDEVVDGKYIRQFAREAKESGVPVFLRFASEMNGEWVPWSGDPKKYIEKFRFVHDIMKEEAPNVAMVWSPNFLPRDNIDQYYPGDAYVDWVGVSLYTIPYSHGEEKLGGNPIDYLKPIYEKYSHKPIMISEGAVSHYSYQLNKDYTQWAVGEIGNMYGFLPKMFPQVKAITYFNLDKSTTSYDNQNNNYDLGDNPAVETAYKKMIQHPYFIDHLTLDEPNTDSVQSQYVSIDNMKEVAGVQNAFVYVKLPLGAQPYYVAVYQGSKKIGESYAQPWEMKINFQQVNTKEPLTIIAFDKNFKRLATKTVNASFKKVDKLGRFSDVGSSFWAFEEIENAVDEGIVKGYPDGRFLPNKDITVAEFVTMLGRTFGKQDELNQAAYPKGVAAFMKSMNYPYSSDKDMNRPITRTEVAEIISGALGYHLSGDNAVKYLLVSGLSKGRNPNNISVEEYEGASRLTRAEAVKFMKNIQGAAPQEIQARPEEPTDTTAINEEYNSKF